MTALQGGLVAALALTAFTVLLYLGRGYWAWVVTAAIALGGWAAMGIESPRAFAAALGPSLVAALVFGVPALRRRAVTFWLMRPVSAMLPRMGDTERIALEAGTVWWDGDLFSGNPDWRKLLDFEVRPLSERERAFLDGPVQELCAMLDEWAMGQAGDLPPAVWDFIKRHRFFGMIIPEEYGGLGFSALGHSAVVTKLASRSMTAAVTVMVPNSLGPAELLLRYGTEEQKRSYLPRLAAGREVPCFALTGPEAGSDAAATQSLGIVCRGTFDGREVLGMRLNWRKRYITLGPVSTVIGLAFRLRDPEHLLGEIEDLGITCALVPSHLPGIEIGTRHDPMGIPFQNGPNSGHDVFVPLDFIIGGPARAGQGWRMLMESLAAGRSISLPALSVGGAQLAARVVGAYATVREQFDTPIGRFEGIEEPLARIGGWTYLMSAARTLTAGAVDAGESPAVVSAIAKCYLTEGMRAVMSDAMDIRAGAGVCRGPRNTLARAYMAAPIGITVEGANILTRSMIIYGQGAIRCHPHVREEMKALAEGDLARFDAALFGHIGSVLTNTARAFLLGLTGARLAHSPVRGPLGTFLRQCSRMSTAFALVSDAAMATLGGQLKRREKLSGRLADALAWLYLASASAKRFWDEGQPERDRPLLEWVARHALYQIQNALVGILDNLPNRLAALVLRWVVFPLGAPYRPPSDALGAQVARALLEDREERLRLTRDIYVPPPHEPGLGRLEAALDKVVDALAVEAKIRDAVRAGRIDRAPGDALVELAREAGVITEEDCRRIRAADEARDEAIQVDAFDADEFRAVVR
jgi:acyl-CoA dehydrogenase